MIVDAAIRAARTPARPAAWEIVLFASALAVSALVALTLLFAGERTYADIVLAPSRPPATFRTVETPPGTFTLGRREVPGEELLEIHRGWVTYLTGRIGQQPAGPAEHFTPAERAHMADVRNVFIAAQVAAGLAAAVVIWLGLTASRRRLLARLVRAGTAAALVIVGALAALAAVAFEAAFLLFHQIFFPQGNFLFEAGSNLLALYPQDYFYGVTLRIGATFVVSALLLAVAAHLSLRRRGASA